MQRSIKFRAWDKKYKKMYYGDIRIALAFPDKDIEIMQYTGLLDKNGKEIYEGDIVKFIVEIDYDKQIYEMVNWLVRWSVEDAYFEVVYQDETGMLDAACNMEIVGNIYENPELVK